MRVLITGKNSFLAKEIQDFFSDKEHDIIPTSRQTLDVSNPENVDDYFENIDVDVVIHTAIKGGTRMTKDTTEDYINNINMFSNLLNNRHKYSLLINFGSGAEFDRTNGVVETDGIHRGDYVPTDFYGAAKNIIARQIQEMDDNIVNMRLFGCFGKHETEQRLIKNSISNVNKGKPLEIHQNKRMDFISAEDTCRVIDYYIKNHKKIILPSDINLCYEQKNTLIDVANQICNLMNVENNVIIKQQGMAPEYTGCAKKLKKLNIELDGFNIGLQRMIESIDTVK
tara:strand:+ start:1040 stop:1888 length:849 start_codon:yes stop_codon:yes gene_type:complete